jgi:hypothetical protein
MIYVPVRPVVFKNYANQNPLEGVEVHVDDETYISDIDGTAYIRKREAFTATARLEGFGAATFSLNESSTDTSAMTVFVYPYVDVTFIVRNYYFYVYGGLQQDATVIFNGEEKTTGQDGTVTFRAFYGTYPVEVFVHEDKKTGLYLEIGTSDEVCPVSVEVLLDNIKPVPEDGSMMLHVTHPGNSIDVSYISDSAFTVDWGDGVTQTLGAGDTQINHIYTIAEATHLIKLINCEGVRDFRITQGGNIAALWTIGNSLFVPDSFAGNPYLVYVGRDIFKNAVGKTSLSAFFKYCEHLKILEDGIFDGLVNVTDISEIFMYAKLTRLPAHCFADMVNLINLNYCFYSSAIGIFDEDLFRDCRKISQVGSAFAANTKVEHIKRGVLPVETDQIIANTSNTFYECSNLKTLYIPASITTMGNNFVLNCPLLQYIEMESETPPTMSSSALSTAIFYIYVPDAAVNVYKVATNWNKLANRILPVSQKPA